MFTGDDLAVLDAIGQAAVPHLQGLLEEEKRVAALGRVTHEFKSPLGALCSVADLMEGEFVDRKINAINFFGYDYFGDIKSWSDIMWRQISNADFLRYPSRTLPLQLEPTLLLSEVIAPTVNQVRLFLRERRFSVEQIKYGDFKEIPRLWVDKNQFQQVIFNLLMNAIKYAYKDPKSFQVEIKGKEEVGEYVIQFRDWGPGIAPELKEVIFEEGVRGAKSIMDHVTGQGLGLWVVRQVVKAHGGKVEVTKIKQPTEFTIYLPYTLAIHPSKRTL